MPEFKITYSEFSPDIENCAYACGIMGVLSFLSGCFKQPLFAFLYITAGFVASLYIYLTSLKCYGFEKKALEHEKQLCNNSTKHADIHLELKELVYPYMCSPWCPCDSGPFLVNKQLWNSYDPSLIEKYHRNNLGEISYDPAGNEVYPMIWTEDELTAIGSFKECYEKVIVPK